MVNLLWSGLLFMMVLTGCGYNGSPTRQNDFIPLTSIEITAVSSNITASRQIAAKTSIKLIATGNYSGLFTRDITNQVVWSSNSPTIAGFITSVNPNRVTGLVPGTAILSATLGGVSGNFTLKVSNATVNSPLILTSVPAPVPPAVGPSVPKGLTCQFTATGTFNDGTAQDLTFDSNWSSSDLAIATVSNDPVNKGLTTAVAATGTATITATFDVANGSAQIISSAPVVQSISVIATATSVLSISTVKNNFTAIGTLSDGTIQDITSQVTWASSNTGIATITTAGDVVTTLSQGTTSISAVPLPSLPSIPNVNGATNLKVTGGNLTGIDLSTFEPSPTANPNLVIGTRVRMTATGTFSNGTKRDITGAVNWSIGVPTIATVTVPVPGENLAWLDALAVTLSPTTVSATYGTVTGTGALQVFAPTLQLLTINPTSMDLTVGTSGRFTVSGNFSDGTRHDLTYSANWTSSDNTIARADNAGISKGRVTGIAAGTPTISASFSTVPAATIAPPNMKVTARTIQNLTIPSNPSIVSGNQFQFSTIATYSDGFSKDVTEDTIWTIDNPNVAILADNTNRLGQVVGVDSGTAKLTATFVGVPPLTVTVTVLP